MSSRDITLAFCVGAILLLNACVLTQETDRPTDENRPPPTPPSGNGSHPHCISLSNISCSDCMAKMGECVRDRNICCFEKPPHMQCMKNVTCEHCKTRNGTCQNGTCCFNKTEPHPPHMSCMRNVTCEQCKTRNGTCQNGTCCFNKTEPHPPHMSCMRNVTCEQCKTRNGTCQNGTCCFNKTEPQPPHMPCMRNVSCEQCKTRNGTCQNGTCCFNKTEPERPHPRCISLSNISCSDCKTKRGECYLDKKLCCFEKHDEDSKGHDDDDDKKESDNDKSDEDDGSKRDSDDDDDDDDDDKSKEERDDRVDGHFKPYNGTQVRCINRKCSQGRSKCGKNGVCLEGKCCYHPTKKEAQSRCEKERNRLAEAAKTSSNRIENHIICTDGSFLARCKLNSNECHCLNASSGQPVGNSMKVTSKTKMTKYCDGVIKKTKAGRTNTTFKLSNRDYSSYDASSLQEMASRTAEQIEQLVPVKSVRNRTFAGSVMIEVVFEICTSDCAATANTSDLYSLTTELVSQIEQGEVKVIVNGEELVASDPTITGITSIEELEAMQEEMPEPHGDERDKKELIIIIVLSVAVVVVMVTLGVVCYFYSKANKAKRQQKYFSDFKGQENPVYMKA